MKKIMIFCAALLMSAIAMAQATPASDTKDVNCAGSVTITAAPATGYHFVQWEDGDLNAERTLTNITESKTYKAIFAADETEINPSIDPGVDFPVAHGTTLHLTPHTDDDCLEFDHWSDIDDPNDQLYAANPRDFEYNGVLPTFTAVFKTKIFQITASTDDAAQGSVSVTVVVEP